MNFANVKLKEGLLIDPHLRPFVEKIVLDNPNFVLSPTDQMGRTSHRCVMGETEAPDNKKFVQVLAVTYTPTDEHLGAIGVKRKYKSRGPDELVYFVRSWRIENQRGESHTSTTTKLTGALRIAKRALIPKVLEEVYKQAGETVSSDFFHAVRGLTNPIRNGHLLMQGGANVMQSYLYKTCNGQPVPPELQKLVTDTFTSEKFHRAMEEYRLAERMEKYQQTGRMCLVVEHALGYVHKGAEGEIMCKQFDELPEWTQNHVSVLQLMKDHEIVNDVGYRHGPGLYLVVSPE